MNHDFSNLAFRQQRSALIRPDPVPQELRFALGQRVTEAYRGADIVAWQGKIERQLQDFAEESDEARNHDYAAKLRQFLKVWRDNTLTGSINIETVQALGAATAVPAVDDWRFRNYFSELRDQLRRLQASTEELPHGDTVPPDQRAPMSAPPSGFGAQEEMPPGEEPIDGQPADPNAPPVDPNAPPVDPNAPPAPGAPIPPEEVPVR
jgi:hypothetical protein